MLGSYWLFIAGSLLLLSILLHQIPLLLLSLLFFLAVGAGKLWNRYCLSRVEYRRKLSADHVFFGEEVQLEVDIANRKALPLPWIHVEDEMPAQVTFLKGRTTESHKANRVVLNNLLSVSWYHRVKRRYPIRCEHRGYFAFGPARIRSGDLFGFFNKEMDTEPVEYLTVYPRIVPLEKLGIPSRQPLGDIRTRRHIFQDPILTLGIREYQAGDSLKRIHWKSTARLQKLQTKIFEPTTTIDMGVFVDVRTVKPPYWGSIRELLEMVIMVAASVANHALKEGYPVGLYVNQNRWFSSEPVRIPPSQNPDQLRFILEALAKLHTSETWPIAEMVAREAPNLAWGSTVVVISAMPSPALASTLLNLKRAGRSVALVRVGKGGDLLERNGIPVYNVPADTAWRQLDSVALGGKP